MYVYFSYNVRLLFVPLSSSLFLSYVLHEAFSLNIYNNNNNLHYTDTRDLDKMRVHEKWRINSKSTRARNLTSRASEA